MSEKNLELKESNFDKETRKGVVVVDFWAEWCNPCKIIAPELDSACKELKGKIKIAKVNIDQNYELAERFEVMSIPTLIFFKNGEIVDKTVGVIDSEEIVKRAKEALK